jgi:thioredoxin-dependent peroxiredoxin
MDLLRPGDAAPSFSLSDQSGSTVRLEDFRGRTLVVYFYPKADTPGCTTQSCALRDAGEDFDRHGTAIVGISVSDVNAQAAFDDKYGLGFPLLSDPDHSVASAWGAWGEKSLYGKNYLGIIRSSFLVDGDGRIVDAWYKVSPKDTVPEALKALAALRPA